MYFIGFPWAVCRNSGRVVLLTGSEMAKRNPPALLLYWLLCGSALCLVRNHFDFFKDTFAKKKSDNFIFLFQPAAKFPGKWGFFSTQDRHKHTITFLKKRFLLFFSDHDVDGGRDLDIFDINEGMRREKRCRFGAWKSRAYYTDCLCVLSPQRKGWISWKETSWLMRCSRRAAFFADFLFVWDITHPIFI